MYKFELEDTAPLFSIEKDDSVAGRWHIKVEAEYYYNHKDLKQLAVFLWHISEGKGFGEAEKLSVEYYEKKLQ